MHKKQILLLLVFLFTLTPAQAASPEIIWLENPADDMNVCHYATIQHADCPYTTASYSDGLYEVVVSEGELIYSALSPYGAGWWRHGYVDQQGNWIIKPAYEDASTWSGGFAAVREPVRNPQDGSYQGQEISRVIDQTGTAVAALDALAQQDYEWYDTQDGYVQIVKREHIRGRSDPYGLADLNGHIVLPAVFRILHLPQDDLCLAQTDAGYGFFSTSGQEIVAPQYQDAQDFSEGLAAVESDGHWGFLNTTGNWQIAAAYSEVYPFCEGLAAVKDGFWGFIDRSGQMVIDAQYTAVRSFHEGLAAVQQNGLWGCIDAQGKTILPCVYEDVRLCSDGRIAVKWQGRYGYFNADGEKIIDFLYGAVTDFHEGLAAVSTGDFTGCPWYSFWLIGYSAPFFTSVYHDNRFGVIDRWGNLILPEEYLCVSDFADGTAICQRASDGKLGIIQAPDVPAQDPGTRSFIRLYLDGRLLNTAQSPLLCDGRTLVPLRTVAQALGADVNWDGDNRTVIVQTTDDFIQLPVDGGTAIVNGKTVPLDAPARIVNNSALVPLRFIAEQLHVQVAWSTSDRSVQLTHTA